MFLQIHSLTSYAAALLNRDDAGLAKRIPFGNAERLRISSQCQKRHWRENLRASLVVPGGIRSRLFFEREILRRVVTAGVRDTTARALTEALVKRLIMGGQSGENPLELKQAVLFGKPEADFFVNLIVRAAKRKADAVKLFDADLKAHGGNYKALLKAAGHGDMMAGIEGAMFGRFVTSDILARTDAAVHVAHAFTVHALATETDFFTVVDDLKNENDDSGAAHAGDMELGAGLFYSYVVVDVPLLVSNMYGCDPKDWANQSRKSVKHAQQVLTGLINAIATVSPGAKLGSTAPYSRAEFLLLEVGRSQPRSLANSYLEALTLDGDPMLSAILSMGRHLSELDAMYGAFEQRFVSSTRDTSVLKQAPKAPLARSVESSLNAIFGVG